MSYHALGAEPPAMRCTSDGQCSGLEVPCCRVAYGTSNPGVCAGLADCSRLNQQNAAACTGKGGMWSIISGCTPPLPGQEGEVEPPPTPPPVLPPSTQQPPPPAAAPGSWAARNWPWLALGGVGVAALVGAAWWARGRGYLPNDHDLTQRFATNPRRRRRRYWPLPPPPTPQQALPPFVPEAPHVLVDKKGYVVAEGDYYECEAAALEIGPVQHTRALGYAIIPLERVED